MWQVSLPHAVSVFTTNITKPKQFGPNIKLVHGKHSHPESQGSMEHVSNEIKGYYSHMVFWEQFQRLDG